MDHYLIWRDELPDAEFVNITRDIEAPYAGPSSGNKMGFRGSDER